MCLDITEAGAPVCNCNVPHSALRSPRTLYYRHFEPLLAHIRPFFTSQSSFSLVTTVVSTLVQATVAILSKSA